ncbi:polysaccharide biosynthesis C-terminal domain-containing protein, partial [Fulvivirga lutimaris]|uniref:polysaccharide biosynthesis C-terminal domain-containing protein n=1 Tax=Fulvivirga lutimaris TaxID=1819566 RepID=UPI001C87EAD4
VSVILFLVVPIILTVYIFPDFFILIIAGKGYLTAIPFLKVTLLFAIVVPFTRQAGTILDSMGKPKINFYLTLFSSVLNVLMNYLFISKFGAIGAAYGTLCSYSIILIVNQVFLYKYLNVSIIMILKMLFSYYWNVTLFLLQKRKSIF